MLRAAYDEAAVKKCAVSEGSKKTRKMMELVRSNSRLSTRDFSENQ